jgi:pyruvate kinase
VPTRAEVNDIFNAIHDRTDAVMLSGETSVGKYPFTAVSYMHRIAGKAEMAMPVIDPNLFDSEYQETFETAGHSVYTLAREFRELNYRAKILVFTRYGYSARMVAKYRPAFPIIALTGNQQVARELNLVWGVVPHHVEGLDPGQGDAEEMITKGVKALLEQGVLSTSDHVIATISSKLSPKRCLLIGLYYVQDLLDATR